MNKWSPDMVIAAILVIGCLALIATGVDGEVKSILTIAAGWCFGAGFHTRRCQSEELKKKEAG